MAAEMAVGVTGITVVPGGMGEAVIRAALAGIAQERVGVVAAAIGMGVAGMVGVVVGIMVVTVAAGELAPRLVSVWALDYSEGR